MGENNNLLIKILVRFVSGPYLVFSLNNRIARFLPLMYMKVNFMSRKFNYGAIGESYGRELLQSSEKVNKGKNVCVKTSLTAECSRNFQSEETEVTIEDALTEAGFTWTQIKLLLILSYVEVVMCADLEAIAFLGPLLLRRWGLTAVQESAIQGIFSGAAIFGCPFWGKFADQYGKVYSFVHASQFQKRINF